MANEQIEKEFNLLYKPWILAKNQQNELKEYSILDIFKYAHEIKQLDGEIPTQDISIMRLLLAIMHGAFITDNVEDREDAKNIWQEIWESKQFPYDIIEDYLVGYQERFWLFHPQYPFYQVSNIVEAINEYKKTNGKKINKEENIKPVARLIGELSQSDNQLRLFAGRNAEQQKVLSYSEAARWLIHLNAFDDDSAKNPTPKGVGYLGQLGLIYAQGENLFETLLLNFVLIDDRKEIFDDCKQGAKAYWEKPVCVKVENLISQPNAQKDLLTMQSRRILLKHNNNQQVTGYLLTMGDYFDKEQVLLNEQMTLWKKDDKENKSVPKKHSVEKQLWRDFSAIIPPANTIRPAGVINWIEYLQQAKVISHNMLKICTVGIKYELKGAGWQLIDFINDSLQINAAVLGELGENWVYEISRILPLIDKGLYTLGQLAVNITKAEGNTVKDTKNIIQTAKSQGYYSLDKRMRQWLVSINPETDEIEERIPECRKIAKNIIIGQGKKILERCSDRAIVGRIVKNKDKTEEINAMKAFMIFEYSVIKTFE